MLSGKQKFRVPMQFLGTYVQHRLKQSRRNTLNHAAEDSTAAKQMQVTHSDNRPLFQFVDIQEIYE